MITKPSLQVLRRVSADEKVLVLTRRRGRHTCEFAVIVVGIVLWEGIPLHDADTLYDYMRMTLPQHGVETERKCGVNDA